MADDPLTIRDDDVEAQRRIDALSDEFEDLARAGSSPSIEDFLKRIEAPHRSRLLCELLPVELDALEETDVDAALETYLKRLPRYERAIRFVFAERRPPLNVDRFLEAITQAGLIESDVLQRMLNEADSETSQNVARFGRLLVEADLLTEHQLQVLLTAGGGPLVLGDYVILDRLGQGGMGQVYKARHRRMERLVALKTLPDDLAGDEDALARFHREVRAAARLSHPNIVTAHDAREDDGVHYLVMEYVDGADLSKLVRHCGPLPPALAAEWIVQAARGLEYAHQQGVIHRDVKPSNLLVEGLATSVERRGMQTPSTLDSCPSTNVKVLDMGLARIEQLEGESASQRDLTGTGTVMGTVDYMAPEQAQNTRNADQRSDIYSLGMTLFYLLTGRTAYDGQTLMERLLAHREQPIPSVENTLKSLSGLSDVEELSSVPHWKGLDRVFQKMVAKQPADRYQTMTELIAELEPLTQVLGERDDTGRANVVPGDPDGLTVKQSRGDLVDAPVAAQPVETSVKSPPPVEVQGEDTFRSETDERTVITPTMESVIDPAGRKSGGSPGRWGLIAAAALLLLAGGYYLWGIIFTIDTEFGTVLVEIEDDAIAATVTTDGIRIEDRNLPKVSYTVTFQPAERAGRNDRVPEGEYELADLPGVEFHITGSDGAETIGREFSLKQGDEVRIRVTAAGPEEPQPPGSGVDETPNFALDFDGDADIVEVAGFHHPPTEPVTYEANVRLRTSGPDYRNSQVLVTQHGTLMIGEKGRWLTLLWDAVEEQAAFAIIDQVPVQPNRDYHLATCWNGRSYRLFVDGQLVAEAPLSEIPENVFSKGLLIGGHLNVSTREISFTLDGVIDEVRISSIARYTENFTPEERFESDEHTLALYHFDEGEGDQIIDSSGNNHHGTIHGATWVRAPSAASYERDRVAAMRVLELEGVVTIRSPSGPERSVLPNTPLPADDFELVGVRLGNMDHSGEISTTTDISFLANLDQLRAAHLGYCWSLGEGAPEILATCPNLEDVALGYTKVTDAGMLRARLPKLKVLGLPPTAISDEVLEHLAQHSPLVESLSLEDNLGRVSDRGLRAIATMEHLEGLGFYPASGFSNAGLAVLADAPRLQRLRFRAVTSIDGESLSVLSGFEDLKSLTLSSNPQLDDEDLQPLSEMRQLESLDLNQLEIGDAALAHLHGLSRLRRVELNQTNVTADGVNSLHESLPNCRIRWDGGVIEPAIVVEPNFALRFDGEDDYVEIPNPEEWRTGPLTVEGYAHVSDSGSRLNCLLQVAGMKLRLHHPGPAVGQWMLVAYDGEASELISDDQLAAFDKPVHIAGVWDGQSIALFVGGELRSRGPVREGFTLNRPAAGNSIGLSNLGKPRAAGNYEGFFSGLIDEVRISNSVRYTEDFTPPKRFEPDDDTLALYHFDEGQGDRLVDSSGNNHHGTIHGATWSKQVAPDVWAPYDRDRRVAELVIAAGSVADLKHPAPDVTSIEELPAEPFRIANIVAGGNTRFNDELLAECSGLTGLNKLLLNGADISGDGLRRLSDLPELNVLAVGNTGVDPAALHDLDRFPSLTHLITWNLSLTDDDVRIICERLPELTRLELSGCQQISDAALSHLKQLEKLEDLRLSGTGLSRAAVDELHAARPRLHIDSEFGTFGPPVVDYAKERQVAEWVTELGGRVSVLLDGRKSQQSVMSSSDLPTEQFVVVGIDLKRDRSLTDDDLESLAGLSGLKTLNLSDTPISGEGLRYAVSLSSLSTLNLERCPNLDESHLHHLRRLPGLTAVSLTMSPCGDAALEHIVTLPRLQTVAVGTETTQAGLETLGRTTGLTRLVVAYCSNLPKEISIDPAWLPELAWLDVSLRHLTPGLVAQLAEFEDLSHLKAFDDSTDRALDAAVLKPLTGLSVLDLSQIKELTDEDLVHLASLDGLSRLRIDYTGATREGVVALHEALPKCRIVSDFGTFEPLGVDYSVERLDAEWVVERGGSVVVVQEGRHISIASPEEFPDGDFVVHRIALNHIVDLRDEELDRLSGLTSLVSLDLRYTAISGQGLEDLSELTNLESLSLDGCTSFHQDSIRHIEAFTHLHFLGLSGVPVGDQILSKLSSWPELTHLSLGAETTVAGLRSLEAAPRLELLVLIGCTALPDQIELDSAWLPSLRALHIEPRQVTPELVAQLTEFGGLNELMFDGPPEDKNDFDASVLSPLTGLAILNLSNFGEGITDEDLTHLAGLSALEFLNVESTAATERGVQTLHKKLPDCHIISDFGTIRPIDYEQHRRIAEWTIDRGGIVATDRDPSLIVDELEKLPAEPFALLVVNLFDIDVTDNELAILDGIGEIDTLSLNAEQTESRITDEGLRHLAGISITGVLHLNRTGISGEGLQYLAGQHRLRILKLGGTHLTDEGLRHLAGLAELTQLDLNDAPITGAGLAHLDSCTKMRNLGLQRAAVTDDGFLNIPDWPDLQRLTLTSTSLSDRGLQALERFENLQALYAVQLRNVTTEGWKVLEQLPELRAIWLAENKDSVTDDVVASLASLPHLNELGLDSTAITDQALEHLKSCETLRLLNVKDNPNVSEAAVRALHEALPDCTIKSDYGRFEAADDDEDGAPPPGD